MLVTAKINLVNQGNQLMECRALLDTGSTTNFITENLAVKLRLPRKPFAVPIGALSSVQVTTKYLVTATISSRVTNYKETLEFLTVPSIINLIPDQPLNRDAINIPEDLALADPDFHRPGPVDILLASSITLSLLCNGEAKISPENVPEMFLQKTVLGWVIGGRAPNTQPVRQRSCNVLTSQFDLSKFWELEEAAFIRRFNSDEEVSEQHYKDNVTRDETGRYSVGLCFNEKIAKLGESRSRAFNRLRTMNKKLQNDTELRDQYHAVIQEYLDLGHMTEVPTKELASNGYVIPHLYVKKDSMTTKVRVVFDASAKTNTGVSLNETLCIGPTIQEDIFTLLVRFRIHQYVLTGDIEKMYRQIQIRPEDRKYQQILWQHSKDDPVKTYQLNTVTFGMASAPYLAIRTLYQLAEDEAHQFPRAAEVLKRDFYVDDLITGTETREDATLLQKELNELLKLGCFNLRQWASNDQKIIAGVDSNNVNKHLILGHSTIKTLGIYWDSSRDSITYTTKSEPEETIKVTKRQILSNIAKIFDPLGLLGPVIIVAKVLLQRLWTLKLGWDSPVSIEIQRDWIAFMTDLTRVKDIRFPRGVKLQNTQEIELHGFCDASQTAYGACIYLRSIDNHGKCRSELLCAKSRVAPVKQVTIPRLELCGAQLLTTLAETVQQSLQHEINRIIYWTDSTIVLHWLNTPPAQLQTFVANRVSDIQKKTDIGNWRHVRTKKNPADLLSRGVTVQEFIDSSLWQHGPIWLQQKEGTWPTLELHFPSAIPEMKPRFCQVTNRSERGIPLQWYSNMAKLVKIIATCLRFKTRKRGSFSVDEIDYAERAVIRWLQAESFAPVLKAMKEPRLQGKNQALAQLSRLNPFIDKDGLIRVGGRNRNADIPYSQRHPIILPKRHHVTKLVIERAHRNNLHSGASTTLYNIRQRYWPLDGRNVVRHIIQQCHTCFRMKPPPVEYIMGELPIARVTQSRPFTNTGVDYCGPFSIKEKKHRNRGKIKIYVAVFVCLAVKAIHLEVVSELTTEAFLAALHRFIARRGYCESLYSDNATNFVGAKNELTEIAILLKSESYQREMNKFLTHKSIKWHFIPPQSPHFGGLWEAAVKSFKHHLHRVIPCELLTFEEFNTLVIEIEAILNSRPLTPISSDANDPIVLTPGHFLIGEALTTIQGRDFKNTPSNRLSSWEHIQKLKQQFWSRWHREYISELSLRTKWAKGGHNIKEGTVVLMKEDHLPALQWAIGRVIKTHPGTDGVIRAVTVKTAKGIFGRNVKKLAPLPMNDDHQLF